MQERSGVESLSAFIKMQLFGKPFKVFVVDENTRVFIDRLSAFNAQYRTIGVEYDEVVRMLRQNFNEKKAMKALYNLEKITVEPCQTQPRDCRPRQRFRCPMVAKISLGRLPLRRFGL